LPASGCRGRSGTDGEGAAKGFAALRNAVIYTMAVSLISIGLAYLIVPHLVGERSPRVIMLLRIYQVNIPAALVSILCGGCWKVAADVGLAGAARAELVCNSSDRFCGLWLAGRLAFIYSYLPR